ncbi:T9SS type A sorting domain-containing protein [Dyadobacter subterraneus]|uniref:T9SS type A sorting domain-containing protein n=1 Tax=Dyadobacter subterraneus TaxID=2773304 RepID=UPI003612DE23
MFPNPGDGVFSLSMGNTKSFELKIMDSKGHHIPILIKNIKDSNDVIVHPQNDLQSGFYQLKVISGDHMKLEMMKVVVE